MPKDLKGLMTRLLGDPLGSKHVLGLPNAEQTSFATLAPHLHLFAKHLLPSRAPCYFLPQTSLKALNSSLEG